MPRQVSLFPSQKAIQCIACQGKLSSLLSVTRALIGEHSDEVSEDIMVVSSQ